MPTFEKAIDTDTQPTATRRLVAFRICQNVVVTFAICFAGCYVLHVLGTAYQLWLLGAPVDFGHLLTHPLGTPVSDYINQVLNDPGPSDPFYGDNPAFHNGVIAPDSLTPADAYPYP